MSEFYDILKQCESEDLCRIVPTKDNKEFIIVGSISDKEALDMAFQQLRDSFDDDHYYNIENLDWAIEQCPEEIEGWGYADEYDSCYRCGNLIHTRPSYGEQQDFFPDYDASELVCGDCVRKDPDDYLNYLINNPTGLNVLLSREQLKKLGFELISDDYENGLYDRHDNPAQILMDALEKYKNGEFIFSSKNNGPYSIEFELWGRNLSMEEKAPERPIFTYSL